MRRGLLVLPLLLAGCGGTEVPSVVMGSSSAEPGASCAPAPAVDAELPDGYPLPPAGAELTAVAGGSVTGRVDDPVESAAAHFRAELERLGYVVQREEDEGRAVLIGFFGAAAEGTVTVAELTCPRGSTGFTVAVRRAAG